MDNTNKSDVLESILNGMDAYVYVTDPITDEILFINDKMRNHFDFSNKNGEGIRCWEVLQSGLSERCSFCPMHRLNKYPDETIVWEEHNTVTKRYYRNSDKLIKWTDGKLVHMQHSIDITEMKEAAAVVDRRLAQQEIMSKISQNFVFGYDIEETVSASLKMAGEFAGYSRMVLAYFDEQTESLKLTHEWTANGVKTTNPNALIPFKRGEYIYDLITEKNSIVPHNHSAISDFYYPTLTSGQSFLSTPIFLKGKLLGILEFFISEDNYPWESSDIHLAEFLGSLFAGVRDRKQAEINFAKMNTLIDRLSQPVVYIDTEENVTHYNAATYEVFGYTEEELLAGGLLMLFGEKTFYRVRTEVWPKAFRDGFIEIDLPLIHKNGNVMIFSFIGVVVHTKDEAPQLATFGADITDLVVAKEAAETASKAKGEFLARMSHEIRTPMNAIIGMTNIAQDSDDPERKNYCLDKISDASKHLLGVINDILDMSKIEANKFEISISEFDFEKMLINITNMICFRMDEKNQNFVVNFDPTIPRCVISDEQRLSQVIVNLLSNAVKFTPEHGTISLDIKRIKTTGNEINLKFIVSDTGIGISPEKQDKLFSSFEQADGSISRKFGGTGLGLVISKRIVELMGGQICIESELGQGTKVIFDIIAEEGSPHRGSNAKISHKINIENLHILAVDDSLATREYFQHLMERLNLKCSVAESGNDALEMIETAAQNGNPFNFFFIDWMMPNMNGIELASTIKEKLPLDSVIIMISATQWSDIESSATKAGIDGFIPKPLFPSALVDCINSCLDAAPEDNINAADVQKHFDFSNYHLLLVEDVFINREIVIALLEDTKIKIDIAENGVEAIEKFETNGGNYDLIFMDIHMPVMDGYEATQKIRKLDNAKAKQIPIIAMTANAFKEDVDKCKECGMNDHVSKPIDIDVMLGKMKKWLNPII